MIGFQCHHLIPLSVVESRSLAVPFGRLRAAGFDPHDFAHNGMHLPCNEVQAAAFGLPLHRGPHYSYNKMVAQRISMITNCQDSLLLHSVSKLQHDLRWGIRRGPVNMFYKGGGRAKKCDYFANLDAAADLLWGFSDDGE